MSLLSSADKLPVLLVLLVLFMLLVQLVLLVLLVLFVLLVLPECSVLLRRGAGLGLAFGLAFGFAAVFGFVTVRFGLLRVMVLCAAMPMGQSMMSRVRMICLGFMMCV